jgi:mediator of RNA polymerase II transcription subunit 4
MLRRRSSMTAILLDNLSRFQLLSQNFFHSISPEIKASPPSIREFLQADAELAAAVQLAHVHQTKQSKIKRLKHEVSTLEESWRITCERLEMEKNELETLIEESEERLRAIDSAKRGSCLFSRIWVLFQQYVSSFDIISGAPCICAFFERVHVCPTQYAPSYTPRPTATPAVLSTFSE